MVSLDRRTALLAYVLLRQAERSLDYALGVFPGETRWEEFQQYYREQNRRDLVEEFLKPWSDFKKVPHDRGLLPPPLFLRVRSRLYYAVTRRFWIRDSAFAWIKNNLERLLELLAVDSCELEGRLASPEGMDLRKNLIHLRQHCGGSRGVLETYCGGILDLKKAADVETFGFSYEVFGPHSDKHYKCHSLAEILDTC